jgi:hypothetical protein
LQEAFSFTPAATPSEAERLVQPEQEIGSRRIKLHPTPPMKLKPTVVKARRTLIALSQEIQLEGYMMPDGQYTLNPTSLANTIRKHRTALLEFLRGKSPQAQACKGFEMLEIEGVSVEGRGNQIKPIPLYVAAAFLRYWDFSEATQ